MHQLPFSDCLLCALAWIFEVLPYMVGHTFVRSHYLLQTWSEKSVSLLRNAERASKETLWISRKAISNYQDIPSCPQHHPLMRGCATLPPPSIHHLIHPPVWIDSSTTLKRSFNRSLWPKVTRRRSRGLGRRRLATVKRAGEDGRCSKLRRIPLDGCYGVKTILQN